MEHMLFALLSAVCVIRLFTRRCAYLSNAERRQHIYLFTPLRLLFLLLLLLLLTCLSRAKLTLNLTWEARHMCPAHAAGKAGEIGEVCCERHNTSLWLLDDLWQSVRHWQRHLHWPIHCHLEVAHSSFHSHWQWQFQTGIA